jgi:hypothetical protein
LIVGGKVGGDVGCEASRARDQVRGEEDISMGSKTLGGNRASETMRDKLSVFFVFSEEVTFSSDPTVIEIPSKTPPQ